MKFKFSKIVCFIFLAVLLSGCSESTLDNTDNDSGSSFDIFYTDDGLADNTVIDIAVDYVFDGVWFATRNGISFYSKADSTFFTYGAEFTGIPNMKITSIYIDNSGTVWAGTEKGVGYLTLGDSLWRNVNQLDGRYVTDIIVANDYSVYFSTRNDGLWIKSNQDIWKTLYNIGPSTDISSLEIGNTGKIWVGTTNGISVLDPQNNSWIMYGSPPLTNTFINVIYKDLNGAMWFGTSSIVTKYNGTSNGTSWVNYGVADGLDAYGINDFTEDNFGILWVATDVGVFFFTGDKWNAFDLPTQVSGELINTIEIDRKTGNLWIGTSNGAVVIYNSVN